MNSQCHLIVESGPDRGKEITVPSAGVRLGRSSRNDVVMSDPAMSRFHCRFFWQTGSTLAVADLGSSNLTLVNGQPIQEQTLKLGDSIAIGDSLIKVVSVDPAAGTALKSEVPVPPRPGASLAEHPLFPSDLKRQLTTPAKRLSRVTTLLMAAGVLLVGVVMIWTLKMPSAMRTPVHETVLSPVSATLSFELTYEKIEASPTNIFRYYLTLSQETLAIQMDDIESKLHVRKERKVDAAVVRDLADSVERLGFFDFESDYQGVAPNIFEQKIVAATIGKRTHTTRILNRLEPEGFKPICELIELFGKNELGLAALARSPDELQRLARHAYLQGLKLYDEREVRDQNLSLAIRAYQEAENYLETIEPKPDFYPHIIAGRKDSERELQAKYEDRLFQAERAIKLQDWTEAARHLRVMCAMIPNRSDERNKQAMRELLDVERHLAPTQRP